MKKENHPISKGITQLSILVILLVIRSWSQDLFEWLVTAFVSGLVANHAVNKANER